MRFLLRLASLFFLVLSVITGVVDSIQTVAAGKLDLTILGTAWEAFNPDSFNSAKEIVSTYVHPLLWDSVLQWVLDQPAAAVFLALSLIFYILGYKRTRAAGRFAA